MIVCPIRDDSETVVRETFCEDLCILDDLFSIRLEFRSECLTEGDSLGGDEILVRSSLDTGEYGTSESRTE